MTPLTLTDVIKNIRDLPALPAVVLELMNALEEEDSSAQVLAEKVSNDQALTAKTLRLANSSFYGLQSKVTTIAQAIAILGFNCVRNLVTATAVLGNFSTSKSEAFNIHGFWRHSIATALCARSLARLLKANQDNAFMVGLLHDIGRLVLATRLPQYYENVLAYRGAQDCYAIEAERAVLGIDHAMVGQALAEHWKFPVLLQQAIADHHTPENQDKGALASIIHVADCIVHALDLSGDEQDMVPPVSAFAWNAMNFDQDMLMRIFRETEMQFEEESRILIEGQVK
ncbi:MAG: HDOD domain-containing protein [Burkholderiales bacterium]